MQLAPETPEDQTFLSSLSGLSLSVSNVSRKMDQGVVGVTIDCKLPVL